MYCIPSASRRGVWRGYGGWDGVEGGVTGCKVQLVLGLDVPGQHRAGTGHVHLPGGAAQSLSHRESSG